MVSDAPRDASDNTLLFHRPGGSDPTTLDHQWSSDLRDRVLRKSHWIVRRSIFPDRVFGNLRDKPDVRRAAKVANLAVHQRHNRLLLRMRHITIFQTVALFRNDKYRHLPFQRIFSPQPPPLRQRLDDWKYSSISRVPSRCPATLITSSVRPRIK